MLLDIDRLLDRYQRDGDWDHSVDPMIEIRSKIVAWQQRADRAESARKPAMRWLREQTEGRLQELVRDVMQCEYLFLPSDDQTRWIVTRGVTSCIVVALHDPNSLPHAATLAHTQQANQAADTINRIVAASPGFNGNWVATLVGGRVPSQNAKLPALRQALSERGIRPNNLRENPNHVLRDANAIAINVALDRHTGTYQLFDTPIDGRGWTGLRTEDSTRLVKKEAEKTSTSKSPPVIQPYR